MHLLRGTGGVLFPLSAAPCLNGDWQAPAQRSDGTPFSSESDCTTYTSGGGVVYKPSLITVPTHVSEGQNIDMIASGFHPSSLGTVTVAVLGGGSGSVGLPALTDATGGFATTSVMNPGACANLQTGQQLTYVDGFGVHASATVTLDCL